MEAAEVGKYSEALLIAAKMKSQGIIPDVTTYSALMTAATHHRGWLDTWAIVDDMLAVGLKPDTNIFNALILAQNSMTSDYVWKVLEKMEELDVNPNQFTFTPIIRRYVEDNNTELAIHVYRAMKPRNIVPDVKTASILIGHVAEAGYPRLALDLLADFEAVSVRRVDHAVWAKCLTASAEAFYLEGVISCWRKFVHELNLNPGEGVCLAVLDTAARNANPDLATDALRVLKSLGIEWEEHHFAPLIEAFCGKKQLKEAIQVLDIMRTQGVEPRPETVSALLGALSDTEAIDSIWALVDEMVKEHQPVDITVLQALISASVNLKDLQRAIGAYKSLGEYGASANITIFNSLLLGCVRTSHRDLGNLLLDDMKAAKIKPDQDTYETFITLCLAQPDYEDAFFYLEEMKANHFHPSYRVYAKIVKTCIQSNDFRYKIALKEMEDMGHTPRSDLKRLIRIAQEGKQHGEEPKPPQSIPLDGSALRFIETGGIEGTAELPRDPIS
ncbi:hypothetical protein H0H87_009753 [Tephrocybe sp. NHM501043]|nr:hypothetical protein H0H87_009753 [Tephrocybe sp. NHM501043]